MSNNGRIRTIEVSGKPREMGRQIGEATRAMWPGLLNHVMTRLNQYRDHALTLDEAANQARRFIPYVRSYAPAAYSELEGVAQGANKSTEVVMLVNTRNEIGAPSNLSDGCTTIASTDTASATSNGIIGQNWDNDPEIIPWKLVLTRRPDTGPSSMSFCLPGIAGYIGINSAGIGICLNGLAGRATSEGLPWYFTVANVLRVYGKTAVTETVERAPRTRPGNMAVVTEQGALDIEAQINVIRVVNPNEQGNLVHTNHCLHPDLEDTNKSYFDDLYGQTYERKARAEALANQETNLLSVEVLKQVLADHEGAPTSICRHPNSHPTTGWQRTAASVVLEPSQGRMHVSTGNPCETPFKIYDMA